MNSHRIKTTLRKNGKLSMQNLPFLKGDLGKFTRLYPNLNWFKQKQNFIYFGRDIRL